MAAAPKKTPKTESLTIRLDPKTRFILEFVARLRGQPLTTVVERFITDGASVLEVAPYDNRTWRDFWHVEEGVRTLKMAAEPALYPTFEEERRLDFAKTHWPFFYSNADCTTLRPTFIDILWPRIDEFQAHHEANKTTAWFSAGRLMQQAISLAGVLPPEWPVGSGNRGEGPKFGARKSPDPRPDPPPELDDEIPF